MIERPSDDASTEEWQHYVMDRVTPLIAQRDTEFREQALPLTAMAARATSKPAVVRELLALAQAAAVSHEGLPDALKAAFAPDALPWPLWLGRPRQAAASGGNEAYFAAPAWEGYCERVYLRESERRRLEAQGLDFATVERQKNTPKDDVLTIMEQAGLGSLGGGSIGVLTRAALEKP
jgi:hypothetical protein